MHVFKEYATHASLLFVMMKRHLARLILADYYARLINDSHCSTRIHFDTNAKVTAAITIVADAQP